MLLADRTSPGEPVGQSGAAFPGSAAAGRVKAVAAKQMPAARGDMERQLCDEVRAYRRFFSQTAAGQGQDWLLRFPGTGWGVKRIARELHIS